MFQLVPSSVIRGVLCALLALLVVACESSEAQYKAAGNLYFKQHEWAEAKAQYQKAVAANKTDAPAHILLANALLELNEYDEARKHYNTALKLDATSGEAHRGLAIIVTHTGKLGDPKALKEFLHHAEAIIKLNPSDRNAIVASAKLISDHAPPNDPAAFTAAQKRAETLLRSTLEFDDEDPKVLYLLAVIYARQGDEATALNVVTRLAAISPKKGYGLFARAVVYDQLENDEQALVAVKELLAQKIVTLDELKKAKELGRLLATPAGLALQGP